MLQEYEKLGIIFESLCCIYPCAPFVSASRLKEGMELLRSSDADCVLPVVKFSYPPQRCLVVRDGEVGMLHPENYNVRSQDLESLYHDAGQFYCMTSEALIIQQTVFCKRTLPLILSAVEVQDIDTQEDWTEAEMKFRLLRM